MPVRPPLSRSNMQPTGGGGLLRTAAAAASRPDAPFPGTPRAPQGEIDEMYASLASGSGSGGDSKL